MKDQFRCVNKGFFNRGQLFLLCLLLPLTTVCLSEAATKLNPPPPMEEQNDGRMKVKPRIEDLGDERYRIGAIEIDKAKRLITIPGVMLPYEKGKIIEFIATMKQGYKSYESVMSLEADAFEFNLACILIGLNSKKAESPKFHFDPNPVLGDPVSIKVGWQKNGKQLEYDVIELLKSGETKPVKPSQWSYTGSMFVDGDHYLAQMDGVLIGLIHDPSSIIEHKEGLALGNYGSIMVDPDSAPENGQALTIKIQRVD